MPLPDWVAELFTMVSVFYKLSGTIHFYASAAFDKFLFIKKNLYLEKCKFLTEQTKFSCSNLHRNEDENMIRATHTSLHLS